MRILGNISPFGTVCLVLTGFLLLQVISPVGAFCLKEGSRIIQCRSLSSPLMPGVNAISEPACCNKTFKEKPPADSQHHSSPEKQDNGSCCISMGGEHDGVICLSFSDFHVLEPVTLFDPVEPLAVSNGLLLNSATEKPPSLVFIQSVVLIL